MGVIDSTVPGTEAMVGIGSEMSSGGVGRSIVAANGWSGLVGAAVSGRRAAAARDLATVGRVSAAAGAVRIESGKALSTWILKGGLIATAARVRSAIRGHARFRGRPIVGLPTST